METLKYKEFPNWSVNVEWDFRCWMLTPFLFHSVKEDEQFTYQRRGFAMLFFVIVWQRNLWKGPSVKKAGFTS